MESASDADRRLTELEIKASFLEDLVDHLNADVMRQQQRIDLLVREVARLKAQGTSGPNERLQDPEGERPPHW